MLTTLNFAYAFHIHVRVAPTFHVISDTRLTPAFRAFISSGWREPGDEVSSFVVNMQATMWYLLPSRNVFQPKPIYMPTCTLSHDQTLWRIRSTYMYIYYCTRVHKRGKECVASTKLAAIQHLYYT